MARQLDEVANLQWRFFDAGRTAPPALRYDPAEARRAIRRELTPGELGCYGSHFAVWQTIAAGPDEAAVVLEDDLLIDPGFFANLATTVEALAGHKFVRLHAKAPTSALIIGRVASRHVVRYRGAAIGAQGYILRREGARQWLASITAVVRPVDDEMERYWAHGVANIGLHPFPIIERMGASTIEDARRGITPPRWHEFGWQARRAVESGRRRLANLTS
jgi:glycosyl transferase family 25